MYKINNMTSSEIFTELTDSQKDDIYRMVWFDRVSKDVESRMSDNIEKYIYLTEAEKNILIEEVSNAYVYYGKYDCNLSYWDNIDNLLDNYMELNDY